MATENNNKVKAGWLRTYSNELFAPKTFAKLVLTETGETYPHYVDRQFTVVDNKLARKPGKVVKEQYLDATDNVQITADIFNDMRAKELVEIENDGSTNAEIAALLNKTHIQEGNEAQGWFAHAEGDGTSALAQASHTEGQWTSVKKDAIGGHAEGLGNTVHSRAGHAEGFGNIVGYDPTDPASIVGNREDYGSHAEGSKTISYGYGSHSEGIETQAIANGAHAQGQGGRTAAENSHVEGKYNIIEAGSNEQHVQGRYNLPNPYMAHIVGNGTESQRSNAHTLDWFGNAWYQGNMTFNGILIGSENKQPALQNNGLYGVGTVESLPSNGREGQIYFLIVDAED